MSTKSEGFYIYPFLFGAGLCVDVFKGRTDEPDGSAEFTFDELVEDFLDEFVDENGYITEPEAVELAYSLIDAMRDAANKLAERLDHEEDDEEAISYH